MTSREGQIYRSAAEFHRALLGARSWHDVRTVHHNAAKGRVTAAHARSCRIARLLPHLHRLTHS